MLNPSTADETDDDRTIGRCVAFAQTWGAGGIVVCNLLLALERKITSPTPRCRIAGQE